MNSGDPRKKNHRDCFPPAFVSIAVLRFEVEKNFSTTNPTDLYDSAYNLKSLSTSLRAIRRHLPAIFEFSLIWWTYYAMSTKFNISPSLIRIKLARLFVRCTTLWDVQTPHTNR